MIEPEYLTTPEAAKYLNLSIQYLEIARHRGDGPRYVKLARMVRYKRSDLDQFMEGNIRMNTCEEGVNYA